MKQRPATRPRRCRPRTRGGAGGHAERGRDSRWVPGFSCSTPPSNRSRSSPRSAPSSSCSPVRPSASRSPSTAAFHSENLTIPAPSVMRLSRYVRVPYRARRPDDPRGRAAPRRAPLRLLRPSGRHHRPRGAPQPGRQHTWENCVAACRAVQLQEGRPAPRELGWTLDRAAAPAQPQRGRGARARGRTAPRMGAVARRCCLVAPPFIHLRIARSPVVDSTMRRLPRSSYAHRKQLR